MIMLIKSAGDNLDSMLYVLSQIQMKDSTKPLNPPENIKGYAYISANIIKKCLHDVFSQIAKILLTAF